MAGYFGNGLGVSANPLVLRLYEHLLRSRGEVIRGLGGWSVRRLISVCSVFTQICPET